MSNTDSFKTYLFSYEHGGSSWVQEIKAANAQDAQARARKLHAATLEGEMIAKVDAHPSTWSQLALRRLVRLISGR